MGRRIPKDKTGVFCVIDKNLYEAFKEKYKDTTKIVGFLGRLMEEEIKK
jgi:hypothetical protein